MQRSYRDTIDYLYELVPAYQKIGGKAIKTNLDNIVQLCAYLENPQERYPTIHIAGTNGKGTTAHMIASVLQSAGYKVGLYTSPHYMDFRERIKVSGTYISKEEVRSFIESHESIIKELRPSFFEVTVAMAFQHFHEQKVDYAIIETGLGGELDSTNIITPLLSVITHISLDHQNYLGPDIYTISKAKAGIIKSTVPVVVGQYQSECDHIFMSKSKELQAPISYASIDLQVETNHDQVIIRSATASYTLRIESSGPFFTSNACTAIQAIESLRKRYRIAIDHAAIITGLHDFRTITNYIGRWTKHSSNPDIISDSAHNIEAIQKVLDRIQRHAYPKVHFILGFVKGKNVEEILSLMDQNNSIYLTQATPDRSLSTSVLSDLAGNLGLTFQSYPDIESAFEAAQAHASKDELIYIGGSSYLVGDFLRYLSSLS